MNGKQLKNSIFQLAIQGKLVPQDPHDEPASELVKRLRTKKSELVKNKCILKKSETKPFLSQESLDELCIPESWEWVQLSDVSIIQEGAGIRKWQYRDNGTQVLCVTNILEGSINLHNKYLYISEDEFKEKYTHLKLNYGDIVTACSGGSWGKTAIFDSKESIMLNTSTLRLRFFDDIANNKFLYYITKSSFFKKQLEEQLSGMQPNFGYAHYSRIMIPLPPYSEQERIVSKIEELMPLVEEYDNAQEKLDNLNLILPDALKKSILHEAIQGKLIPQDPTDESASILLQRIYKVKEQLVKKGKLKKKDIIIEPVSDDEKSFDIPESWVWCRLNDIGIFERGSGIKRDETKTEGYPCVRYGEMYTSYRKNPTFDRTLSFTTKDVFDKCRKARKGDLFMALTGENKQDIALAAQYIGDEDIAVGGDLCHFTVLESFALYFVYLINSPYYSSKKELLATGDIIVHISADKLGSIPIPFPPVAEQQRIVKKITELFNLLK